jgi:hypothetical protein
VRAHRVIDAHKATMITLAVDDGADADIISTRVTHAKPVTNAFDHYYRGTKWLVTCEQLSKLRISLRADVTSTCPILRDNRSDRFALVPLCILRSDSVVAALCSKPLGFEI